MSTSINISKKITVKDEGATLTSDVNSINFTGVGVTGSVVGNDVTIDIPGNSGAVTSVTGTAPIVSSGGTTPAISIPQATALVDGFLDSADFASFSAKQDPITLTTTGTSGLATLVGTTLNIPGYTLSGLGGVPTSRTLTINGTALDLSADRTWNVGTVTSAGITAGTGISLSGTNPITSSGSITVTNSAPDQIVTLTAGTGIGVTGTYPNFTIDNTGAITDTNIYNTDGTITGPRQVDMNGQIITFDGGASDAVVEFLSPNTGGINFRNGTGQKRWAIAKDVDGTGSNFILQRFDATGSLIEDSIFIDSSTGAIQFNNSYSFPTTDGASDQVLMTDGAGNVNWISIADRNIYDIDGVLGSNRILSMDGKNLRFENENVATGNFQIQIGEYLSAPILNSLLYQDQSSFSVEITDDANNENSLVIQSANSFQIGVTDGVNSRSVLLNTSGFTINSAYTLPNTDGTNNQILSTDGAGNLSWQTSSATNIYNSDGTLTGTRVVNLNGNNLEFQDAGLGSYGIIISNGVDLAQFTMNQAFFDVQQLNVLGHGSVIVAQSNSLLLQYIGASGNKQLELTNNGITVNAAYRFPNTDGTAGQIMTTNGAGVASWSAQPEVIQAAASDETTNLTTGTAKVTFRMPFAMTLTGVRASLSTAQTAGALLTVDINLNGTSVLGTKLTFDNNEKTTVTAATPATIVTSALTDDGEITVDIDAVGTAGARGLKITLIGTRA